VWHFPPSHVYLDDDKHRLARIESDCYACRSRKVRETPHDTWEESDTDNRTFSSVIVRVTGTVPASEKISCGKCKDDLATTYVECGSSDKSCIARYRT
jgi:hypothetical protein